MKLKLLAAFTFAFAIYPAFAVAQKIKVDYDIGVAFENFKTYTWGQLNPAGMPLLQLNIIGAIDEQLSAKGLVKVEKDADLMVTYVGGVNPENNQGAGAPIYPGYAGPPPSVDSTMWTGSSEGGSKSYPKCTITVELMDPHTARITWRAVGTLKLNIEKKNESLTRINDLIAKMFVRYPPQPKSKK